MFVAMEASGYAARSACTTATDELPPAAQSRGVAPNCAWNTAARRWMSDEVDGADVRDRVLGRYAGRGAVKTACRGPSACL